MSDDLDYDPAVNDYRLADDPRCLFGWGPPRCGHYFGHMCSRPFGHRGRCHDAVDPPRLPCESVQRPKLWDSKLREECNR